MNVFNLIFHAEKLINVSIKFSISNLLVYLIIINKHTRLNWIILYLLNATKGIKSKISIKFYWYLTFNSNKWMFNLNTFKRLYTYTQTCTQKFLVIVSFLKIIFRFLKNELHKIYEWKKY